MAESKIAGSMPEVDEAVARRQLHFVLALDCSGSMRGEKIASLNYAIRSAIPELRDVAEENPEVAVVVSAIRFADEAKWHLADPTPIETLEWHNVSAGGETAMGAALEEVVAFLDGDRLSGRQLPPVVLLVTDGYPTDDVDAALEKMRGSDIAKSALRIVVAIGDSWDPSILEQFIDDPSGAIRPLAARNAPDLVRFIKWASTAPVRATSRARSDLTSTGELGQQITGLTTDDSEMVW